MKSVLANIKPTPIEIPDPLNLLTTLPDGVRERAIAYYQTMVDQLFHQSDILFIDPHSHSGVGKQWHHRGEPKEITPNLADFVELMWNYHYPPEEIHSVIATFENDRRLTGDNSDDLKAHIVADNIGLCSETVQWFVTRVLGEYKIQDQVDLGIVDPRHATAVDMLKASNRGKIDQIIKEVAAEDPTGRGYLEAKRVRAMVMTNDLLDELDPEHHQKYFWFPPSARVDYLLTTFNKEWGPKELREKVNEFFQRIIRDQWGVYAAASLPPDFTYEDVSDARMEGLNLRGLNTKEDRNAYRSYIMKLAMEACMEFKDSKGIVPIFIFAGVNRGVIDDQVPQGGQDLGGSINIYGYLNLMKHFPEARVVLKPYQHGDNELLLKATALKPNLIASPIWWFNHNFNSAVEAYKMYLTRAPHQKVMVGESDAYRVQYFAKIDMLLQAYAAAGAQVFSDSCKFYDTAKIQWLEGPERVFPRLKQWRIDKYGARSGSSR